MVLEWNGEDLQVLERKITCSSLELDMPRGKLPKLRQKDVLVMGGTEMPNFWATETLDKNPKIRKKLIKPAQQLC